MTNAEIVEQVVWRDANEARLKCFSLVLGFNVDVHVLTENEERLSLRSLQVINDFLVLSLDQLEKIKQFLWQDCQLCCDVTSYGFDVPDGGKEVQVNHDEFGVHGPEDAFQKSSLKYLLVAESDQESCLGNYGRLTFDNEWNGHFTTVVMKNGAIVGFGDSGLSIGKFEQHP